MLRLLSWTRIRHKSSKGSHTRERRDFRWRQMHNLFGSHEEIPDYSNIYLLAQISQEMHRRMVALWELLSSLSNSHQSNLNQFNHFLKSSWKVEEVNEGLITIKILFFWKLCEMNQSINLKEKHEQDFFHIKLWIEWYWCWNFVCIRESLNMHSET